MQVEIGSYEIIDVADTITVFAMQIGVTRIANGGRVLPRTRKGAMTSVKNLVASEVEIPEERCYPAPAPRSPFKPSPAGRTVVALVIFVVGMPITKVIDWGKVIVGCARVLYCLLFGRPGRLYRTKRSWHDVYHFGLTDLALLD